MAHEVFGSLKSPLMVAAAALGIGIGAGDAVVASSVTVPTSVILWGHLGGESIDVQNSDFEALTLREGGFSHDIPGWSIYNGEAGTFNPTVGYHVWSDPFDSTGDVALGGGSAAGFTSIQQNLAEVITAGSHYKMRLAVGLRADGPYQADQFVVGLYATDGATSYDLGEVDWTDVTLGKGGFRSVIVDTGVLDDTYAGMNLRIELTTFGFDANRQVLFDNIVVQSPGSGGLVRAGPVHAPTPTAATAGLAVMGGLLGRRRWNREA